MRPVFALVSAISVLASSGSPYRPRPAIERVVVNDNRAAGGTLRDGVLTLRLAAREGEWHPDGDAAPGIVVRAFGPRSAS